MLPEEKARSIVSEIVERELIARCRKMATPELVNLLAETVPDETPPPSEAPAPDLQPTNERKPPPVDWLETDETASMLGVTAAQLKNLATENKLIQRCKNEDAPKNARRYQYRSDTVYAERDRRVLLGKVKAPLTLNGEKANGPQEEKNNT